MLYAKTIGQIVVIIIIFRILWIWLSELVYVHHLLYHLNIFLL